MHVFVGFSVDIVFCMKDKIRIQHGFRSAAWRILGKLSSLRASVVFQILHSAYLLDFEFM